jgi:hypothetical protein
MSDTPENQTLRAAIKWLLSGDTGISSETILSAALGIKRDSSFHDDAPHDNSDFGRCYRLLRDIPQLREPAFEKLKKRPEWRGLIAEWDALSDMHKEGKRGAEMYQRISRLRGDKRVAA